MYIKLFLAIAAIVLVIALSVGLTRRKDLFTSLPESVHQHAINRPEDTRFYNSLYVSPNPNDMGSYLYMQPMGDTQSQAKGDSGQGTSGAFLPLQGIGAGVFMKNSSDQNYALMSSNAGMIGGTPNYTEQEFSSAWNGFNNFGYPFDNESGPEVSDSNYTNSYLIDGANQRVVNSGQKADQLNCQPWDPKLKKDARGFCVQGSDAIVDCETNDDLNNNISACSKQGSIRFLENKMLPQWMKL